MLHAEAATVRPNRNPCGIKRPQKCVPDRPAVAAALNSLHAGSLSVPGTLAMLDRLEQYHNNRGEDVWQPHPLPAVLMTIIAGGRARRLENTLGAPCSMSMKKTIGVDLMVKFTPNEEIFLPRHLALANTLVVDGAHIVSEADGSAVKEMARLENIPPVSPGTYISNGVVPPGRPCTARPRRQ